MKRVAAAVIVSLFALGCSKSDAKGVDAGPPDLFLRLHFEADPAAPRSDVIGFASGASIGMDADELKKRWNEQAQARSRADLVINEVKVVDAGFHSAGIAELVKDQLMLLFTSNKHDGSLIQASVASEVKDLPQRRNALVAWEMLMDVTGPGTTPETRAEAFEKLGMMSGNKLRNTVATVGNRVFALEVGSKGSLGFLVGSARKPLSGDQPFDWRVPSGKVSGYGSLPDFTLYRLDSDKGRPFLDAAQACRKKGLSLCTDAQWQLACAGDKGLAKIETWTTTLSGSLRKIQVRGGGPTCEAGTEAKGSEASPDRAGICCSRAVAITGDFGVPISAPVLAYEAAINAHSRQKLLEAFDRNLEHYYLMEDVPKEKAVQAAMEWIDKFPDFWVINDQCAFGEVNSRAAVDCQVLVQQKAKLMLVKSRYFMGTEDRTKIGGILDLTVLRPLSPP